MKEKLVKKEEFITTKWAGGETTQLAIYPEDSVFLHKDFLWRISSATFTSTESRFSDFTGYQRYILPLKGELFLKHNRLYNRNLKEYDVEYFDGAWETSSKNSIDLIDYNFIVKSGYLSKMQLINNSMNDEELIICKSEIVTFFSADEFIIELDGEKREIKGSSLYIIESEGEFKVKIKNYKLPVIITMFSKIN